MVEVSMPKVDACHFRRIFDEIETRPMKQREQVRTKFVWQERRFGPSMSKSVPHFRIKLWRILSQDICLCQGLHVHGTLVEFPDSIWKECSSREVNLQWSVASLSDTG